MTTGNHQMGAREWSLLGFLSILWGASFIAIGIAVSELPPLTVVAIRVSLAALGLYLYMKITGVALPGIGHPNRRQIWGALLAMGLLNNILPFSLISYGQTHVTAGVASILNATTPLFTVFVAHVLTQDEKLTPQRIGGVVIGFLGVAAIIGPESLQGFTGTLTGQASVLGGALCYAFGVTMGRRFVTLGLKPVQMAFGQIFAASIMLTPVALVVDQPFALPVPGVDVWVAVTVMALVSTSLAYLIFFRLIAEAGATNASLVTLLVPVVATVLGIIFFGELPKINHGIGLSLIALGLMVLDGRVLRRLRRAA